MYVGVKIYCAGGADCSKVLVHSSYVSHCTKAVRAFIDSRCWALYQGFVTCSWEMIFYTPIFLSLPGCLSSLHNETRSCSDR